MKLQLLVLCCILQSICGFNLTDHIIYPPDVASERIVGGTDAADGAAPFQCSLQVRRSHFCGCSILSDKWVLTASHCLAGQTTNTLEIMVGTNRIGVNTGGTFYKTEKITMHPGYNQPRFANDIGVVKVKGNIEFTDLVKPIGYSADEVPDGAKLQLTGWGATRGGGSLPQMLQIITLNAVQTKRCRDMYNNQNVHDSHICTFNKRGEGACNGDSGGPLVYKFGDSNQFQVVGVVNFGVPCAMGYPDAYAKVSYLYNWIKENTD